MAPPLLALRDATVRLAERSLFAGLTLTVERGERICLVGRNGAGKSTLLKAIAGLIELDQGERFLQPRSTVAYLPQAPALPPGQSLLEATLAGLPPAEAERRHLAEALLERFELAPRRPVDQLSGGEARRVALARALIGEPDLLLLDEPTNHLDIATIERLEQDLAGLRGALVMVSHDRAFLAALSRTTWWLDRGRLQVLNDGFAAFEAWSAELLAQEQAELHRLARTIEAETEWLHFGVTARRKRNQGRLRRLQTLRRERAARIAPDGRVRLATAAAPASGQLVIEAADLAKRFGERTVIDGFSTRILRGDRVGIIGPNGSGKTTLLQLLTGRLAPDRGTVRLGTGLQLSLIDQQRASLDSDATPWTALCPDGGDQVEVRGRFQHVVSYLRDFLFRPEQMRTPIRALSGGERNRLALAQQLARPANLLVMDEPTNDLDMDTLDLLQEVLADYDGTLLLVSHDRDFLDRLVTSVIAFEGAGRLREYAGGWSDYRSQRPAPASAPPVRPRPAPARPAARERAGERRKAERELARLIRRIEALQGEIAAIEQALGDAGLYRRDPAAFARESAALEAARAELAAAEQRWLELELALEEAPS
jgi:ATP-binding cassette subfamily F protein uup